MKIKAATQLTTMKPGILLTLTRFASLLLVMAVSAGTAVQAQTLALQLKAANYNPTNGLWTATVGPNAQATSTLPTLLTNASPNGSSAVVFTGANPMQLASSIDGSSGYTVFAYVKQPSYVANTAYALLGGGSGSFEYRLYNGKQDALRQQQADLGSETTVLTTNVFNLIDATVSSSGGAFRLNGVADGTTSGSAFSPAVSAIGARSSTGGENFSGYICEIDIYTGVLNSSQISAVEAALTASYVTVGPALVIGLASVSPTNNVYAGTPVTLSAAVSGATNTTTFRWQTDSGSGGASFANIGGATSTNYVLNTSSLLGTYEYQLIGTPASGSSVTSAPVSLTVQAASAPTLVTDTTANPGTASVAGNETFSAAFVGTLPISYQWQVSPNSDGSGAINIVGATNTTLVLNNLQLTNSGYYYGLRATNTVAPYFANSSWTQLTVQPLTPLVQLIATNYDGSSVWTDSSGNGNNATYAGSTPPTVASFVTPNGGSAVNIAPGNNQSFLLASSLDPSSGYTVFAYLLPTNKTSPQAITGGSSSGALEYSIKNLKQHYTVEYVADIADGSTNVSTNSFSLVDLAVNSSTGAFRYNGVADGANVAGATFTSPITRIGNNEGGGDGFVGLIAEIDIYNGALSSIQISNVEAQLIAKYVTVNSITIGAAAVAPTNNTYAGNPITLSAPIIGATGTTTYKWQTDNGSGGATFSNISGATSTNYVLNTTALLGTYEYQLIATPFGGNSVTSAPATLTVQAASAPVLASDTTANPSVATVGGSETFSAAFAGTLPISYQWQVSPNANGSGAFNIAGATNSTLVLNNLQLTNSGYYYSLRATNKVAPYFANSSWTQLTVQALTPLVQLIANNYDGSSVWTDSSGNGNNATYSGTQNPTLVASATPNGSTVVNVLTNDGSFLLASSLDPSSGYTVFAYIQPTNNTGPQAITGGSSSGALEYSIKNLKQHYTVEYVADIADGSTNVSTNSFSLVDLAVNSSTGAFRYNGVADGANVAGATFTSPITRIGNNEGGGDGFVGLIAEIDIYNGALSSIQISNVEAQLTAKYGIPGTIATNRPAITAKVSGNVLQLSWPAGLTGWPLLVQTNHLASGLSANTNDWSIVPGSTSVNQTNITINPALPTEFYKLVPP